MATRYRSFPLWLPSGVADWGRRAGIWAGSCSGCSTTTPTADGRRRPRRRCAARAGLHFAECRQDVEPDQVVVSLAGRVLQLGDLQPLRDRLADGDRGLRVAVLVDVALKLGQH